MIWTQLMCLHALDFPSGMQTSHSLSLITSLPRLVIYYFSLFLSLFLFCYFTFRFRAFFFIFLPWFFFVCFACYVSSIIYFQSLILYFFNEIIWNQQTKKICVMYYFRISKFIWYMEMLSDCWICFTSEFWSNSYRSFPF